MADSISLIANSCHQMQATLKDGTNQQRLVVMLKALQPLKAHKGLIASVVAHNAADEAHEAAQVSSRGG